MPSQSEERRMSALLRDLMLRSGMSALELESRLGWEAGRLNGLLAGQKGLSFETLLEILPALDSTPGDFFAQLGELGPTEGAATSEKANRVFEESRRVVKAAIARRRAWKEGRTTSV
jgi:transcriptional regulator with XRE-family HTH domain